MEFVNRKVAVAAAPPPPPPLPPSSSCISSRRLEERIWKLLSKWAALEMAVENEWGGPDSIVKSHKLASDVLSWLFHSKAGEIKVEDLENLLHERLLLTFNTEIEDGSIEEVAEQLMNIRDEYLHGNIISVNSVQSNNNIHQLFLHQKVLQQKKTANSAEKSWSYDHQDTLNVSYTW